MFNKCKSVLYNIDFFGEIPQLYIFGNKRYKTSFSCFLSIIISILTLAFILYSLIQYFQYNNPIVSYSKSSDDITKRSINLEDTFLMFQLIDTSNGQKIDESIAFFQGVYQIIFDNGSFYYEDLEIEKCELGKNINLKYKDTLLKKLNFGRPIDEFYCINLKNGNLSLFYNPHIGYSIINLNVLIKDISKYTPEKIESLIVSENNVIDHKNKNKPISESYIYHMSAAFNSLEYTDINYNIQYIKYESDDGFFYPKNKDFIGTSFSSIGFIRKISEKYNLKNDLEIKKYSNIGSILFEINKSNYDNYKRSYQRIQSLLAEIMSVISILFEVGRQMTYFVCNKKMSKDIIRFLISKDEDNYLIKKNRNINLIKNQDNSNFKILSNNREINNEQKDKINVSQKHKIKYKNRISVSKDEIFEKIEEINKSNINNKVLKEINYFHILKSYFCFKDMKTKLINICQNIILEDICVENLLKRLYNLENIYNHPKENDEKLDLIQNQRFKTLHKYIYKINKEFKNTNNN